MLFTASAATCAAFPIWKKSLSSAHAAAFVRRVYGPAEQAALGLLKALLRR